MIKSFAKLSATFSAVKPDFKEDPAEASGTTSTTSSSSDAASVSVRPRVVRLVSSRAIQGRAPIPTLDAARRARVSTAVTATGKIFFFSFKFFQTFKFNF